MKVNRLWVKSKLTSQIKHFAGEVFWCYSLLPGELINGSENLENWEELWFFYSNFVNYLCLGDSFQRGVRSGLNTLLYRLSVVIHWMPKSDASWFPLRNSVFPQKQRIICCEYVDLKWRCITYSHFVHSRNLEKHCFGLIFFKLIWK